MLVLLYTGSTSSIATYVPIQNGGSFLGSTHETLLLHYCSHYIIYFVSFLHLTAAVTVSLELQGGDCSDQLTLICRHSDRDSAPLWIHNGTAESGSTLGDAFPGAVYTVHNRTEHTTTITGIDNVRALDGYLIQCVYDLLGNLTKSNAVKYSFIPPGQSWNNYQTIPLLARWCALVQVVCDWCGSRQLNMDGSEHMQTVLMNSVWV